MTRVNSVVYQVIKSHRFGGMSNNSGQKAKIKGKSCSHFGSFTIGDTGGKLAYPELTLITDDYLTKQERVLTLYTVNKNESDF
jgi:hypothetical protein